MSVEKVDIVLARDKDGNVIYPVTSEDAVLLRDGSYLSDKLDTLKIAENMSGKVNAVIKEVKDTLTELDELTEDSLVFDDELATSDLQVHDVTELLNSIENKMQILYRLAVIADEDEEISLIVEKTILENLELLKVEIEILKATIDNIGDEYTGKEIVYDDDEEYEPDGIILTGSLSEELIKLNNKLNNFKIHCDLNSKALRDELAGAIFKDPYNTKVYNFYTKEETLNTEEIKQFVLDSVTNIGTTMLDTFYDRKQIDELLSHKAPLSHSHDNIYVNEGQDLPATTVKFDDSEYLQSKYDDNRLVDHSHLQRTYVGTMENDYSLIDNEAEEIISEPSFEVETSRIVRVEREKKSTEIINPRGQIMTIIGDDITTANRRFVKYYDYIKQDLGLKQVNLQCIRFGTFAMIKNSEEKSILNKIEKVSDDTDIILVMAGINDVMYRSEVGNRNTLDDRYTIYGSINTMCKELLTNFPDKLVIFVTPTNTRDKDTTIVSDIIKEVCKIYAIPVYDNHELSGIYPKINGTLDGIHWNENTHKRVGKRLSKFIDSLNY